MVSLSRASLGLPWVITAAALAFALGTQSSGEGGLRARTLASSFVASVASRDIASAQLPELAQLIVPADSAVLDSVPPPAEFNATNLFVPRGKTLEGLKDKPFHVYHQDFLAIIGPNPTLTLIAETESDPLFHEAPIWYPPTDEMFFVQNAGAPAAGTGLKKSSVVQKVSLAEAGAVSHLRKAVGQVQVQVVRSEPEVINPNGGTNYKGQLVFAGEGQGDDIPSALYLVNPVPPYNATVLINNYFGRQFSSLNDVTVNPRNGDLYFTDTLYGYYQDFRPEPGLPRQVYRLNMETKAITVVADGFALCNGITISPDGMYAYVTDTGINRGFKGFDFSQPSTVYRYDVAADGTFENRKVFAHVSAGVPDGVHCDTVGNVYAGCGDGVHVWNTSGTLLGKIFVGEGVANFQFAGKGRMVLLAETQLWYATLAAEGAPIL